MKKQGGRTLKDVSSQLEMKPRKIQFFSDQQGLLYDFIAHGRKGVAREYSDINVIDLLLIKELSDYGITISVISDTMYQFHKSIHQWWDFDNKKFLHKNYLLILSTKLTEDFADPDGSYIIKERDTRTEFKVVEDKEYSINLDGEFSSAIIINIGALAKSEGY